MLVFSVTVFLFYALWRHVLFQGHGNYLPVNSEDIKERPVEELVNLIEHLIKTNRLAVEVPETNRDITRGMNLKNRRFHSQRGK